MTDEAFEVLAKIGQAADEAAPEGVSWSWEDRLQAALLVLPVGDVERFLKVVGAVCDDDWDGDGVRWCGDDVAALVTEMAGLRDGQRLLVRHMDANSFAYFTTWPWDDKKNVSIRFGVYYPAGELTDYAISNIALRRGLGIE